MENLVSQGGTLMVIGMATVFAFLVLLIGAMKASAAYLRSLPIGIRSLSSGKSEPWRW